jgi:zinc/manganese transport system permease protein
VSALALALHEALIAPFAEFAFMRRALAGLVALALAGAPLGVLLMLRRMALTGDGMSHAILPGTAIAYLFFGFALAPMTIGGILAGLFVATAAGALSRATALKEDASLAAFYLVSLALGVVIVSLRGTNVDLMHFLFGSILGLDDAMLILVGAISSLTLLGLAILWRPLVMDGVDPGFLRTVSRAGLPSYLAFLALMVLNLVAGFHALGTLLAVGFLVLPAVASRFWTRDLNWMAPIAALVGLGAGFAGLLASYHASVPTGPAMILALGAVVLVSLLFGRVDGLVWRHLPRRHLAG